MSAAVRDASELLDVPVYHVPGLVVCSRAGQSRGIRYRATTLPTVERARCRWAAMLCGAHGRVDRSVTPNGTTVHSRFAAFSESLY